MRLVFITCILVASYSDFTEARCKTSLERLAPRPIRLDSGLPDLYASDRYKLVDYEFDVRNLKKDLLIFADPHGHNATLGFRRGLEVYMKLSLRGSKLFLTRFFADHKRYRGSDLPNFQSDGRDIVATSYGETYVNNIWPRNPRQDYIAIELSQSSNLYRYLRVKNIVIYPQDQLVEFTDDFKPSREPGEVSQWSQVSQFWFKIPAR